MPLEAESRAVCSETHIPTLTESMCRLSEICICDVLASCQPFDQTSVELPSGSIVDVSDIGLRLVKPGAFDETLQAVALTAAVFDVDKQTEAILEGNVLHLWVIHLCDKSI